MRPHGCGGTNITKRRRKISNETYHELLDIPSKMWYNISYFWIIVSIVA
jgi:hypothetical protein